MSIENEVHRSSDVIEAHLRVQLLEQYCASDSLSVEGLQQKINQLSLSADMLQRSSFLHLACSNETITLEIAETLLDLCPEATEIPSRMFYPEDLYYYDDIDYEEDETGASPLHVACAYSCCPSSVIELLLRRNPSSASQQCVVELESYHEDDYEGLFQGVPLHYYVMRKSNIKYAVVKSLISAHPNSLTNSDNTAKCTPIHLLLFNPKISSVILQLWSKPNLLP